MSIAVGPAGKVGDGVNAYYVYKVTSDTFSIEPIQVDRRYSDFLWLHTQLAKQCAGYIIPPLPAKVVPLLQGSEFLERRRSGLERFLRKVVEHDELKNTNYFRSFLECSPVELTALKAASQKAETSTSGNGSPGSSSSGALAHMAQKSQQLNSWWGKAYQRMAENDKVKLLAAKAGRDLTGVNTIEDPDFDRVLKYVSELNALVKSMQTRAQNAHKANKLAAGAYCELIECMNTIADVEESLSTSSSTASSDFGAVLALLDTRARLMDSELAEFSESIEYFARWVSAVMNAINVREDRRLTYQAKLAAKGKDANNNASQDVLEAKDEYERVHQRVMTEIQRFQAEKAIEIRRMFAQYAKVQMLCTTEMSEVLTVSNKALEQPVTTQQFTTRFSKTGEPGNNEANEMEEAMRKMDIRKPETTTAVNKVDPEGNEQYSDVCL
ncbi:hypothetical protein Poli38472_002438 [Pythium oligandrum]|uniref:PX domain-containing protein n=1 Tax=Pythium oligandrum TaxID=41045 RepID=A0A8K1FL55_PYTOL|nr:hypothetical protein Poli38472_002438 [Pythium oligandrum]|eukprot:TMW63497.1 hypothetical protein Poli38472_002438 [Pythium oligandrum]